MADERGSGEGGQPYGRRDFDQYRALTVEAIGVLLVELAKDISELKSSVKEGFEKIDGRYERLEDRVLSLEKYREREDERNAARVAAEGNISVRLPVLAAVLTFLAIVAGLATAILLQHPG